jgi:hypothetical protein
VICPPQPETLALLAALRAKVINYLVALPRVASGSDWNFSRTLNGSPSPQPSPPMGMCVKLSVFPLYDRFFWNHTAQNEGVFIIH